MNDKTKRPRASKLKPEERKKRLLQTAVDVFANTGISSVKHVDVAKAAGVAPPTVFSYFPSREALINAVLDEVGEFIVSTVVDVTPEQTDVQQRLFQSGLRTIELSREKPNYIKVWLMWGGNFVPALQNRYRQYECQILNKLCEMIKTGSAKHDPDEDIHDRARMILGSSTYLQKMIFEGVSDQRQQAFVRHIVSFADINHKTSSN